MLLRDLVAIPEHLGDNRSWDFGDKFPNRSVSCAEQVDPQLAESVHQSVGVQVLSRSVAGEEPWTIGSASSQVGTLGDVLSKKRVEGGWDRGGRHPQL